MEEKNVSGKNEDLDAAKLDLNEIKRELDQCEVRLSELKGASSKEKLSDEFDEASGHLKACRLIVDEIEGKSGDEATDAKYRLVKSLSSMRHSMRHMDI